MFSLHNQTGRSLQEVGLAIPSRLKLSWNVEVLQWGVFNKAVVWLDVTRLGMDRMGWDVYIHDNSVDGRNPAPVDR